MKLSWNTCIKVGVSVFALYICIHFWPTMVVLLGKMIGAFLPLAIGCAIAYILSIPMTAFESRFFPRSQKKVIIKMRRPLGVLVAFLLMLGIITAIIWLIVPQLIDCIELLLVEVQQAFSKLISWAEQRDLLSDKMIYQLKSFNLFKFDWDAFNLSKIDWEKYFPRIFTAASDGVEWIVTLFKTVFSGVVTGVLSLIFAVYLLVNKEKLKKNFHALARRYFKEKWVARTDYVASVLHDCFRRYIVGQCTEALILGVLCMLGMWVLQLPYASMVGALIAFTALIPVAGAFIGGAIGAFMILTVSPMKALIFLIFLVVLQQLENNIIYPKVVGTSLGLPALWVLVAVTIGGGVLGIPGMLLGVPLTAAVYRMVRDDLYGKEKTKEVEPAPEIFTEEPPTE